MTTSIFTSLIEPICENYYKYQKTLDIQQANINTIRNYGFDTTYALNFGFEVYQPVDLNEIKLQPGVFTTNSQYTVIPSNLDVDKTLDVQNLIALQDLPQSGIGTVVYQNKTLPVKISILSSGPTLAGIASYFVASSPYEKSSDLDSVIIRDYESAIVNDSNLSGLIFVNFENATIRGINTAWQILPASIYSTKIHSYRYNNGFGQFYSFQANSAFIPSNISINTRVSDNLFGVTYMYVYNWANLLTWDPDFTTWYGLNKSLIPPFTQQFLLDYFNLS